MDLIKDKSKETRINSGGKLLPTFSDINITPANLQMVFHFYII